MMKSKKLLSALLTFLMVFSLVAIPQSVFAAATTVSDWNFDSNSLPTDSFNKIHCSASSLVAAPYGKIDNGYVMKSPASDEANDKFFQLSNSTNAIPAGGKIKLSFDFAIDAFGRFTYERYVSLKFNGSNNTIGGSQMLFEITNGSVVALRTQITTSSIAPKAWHNFTAILNMNADNTKVSGTAYIDGSLVSTLTETSLNAGAATYISDMRFVSRTTADNPTYWDNVLYEIYDSTDNVSVNFSETSSSNSGETFVDADNATINLTAETIGMKVSDFKTKSNGFIVVDGTGASASDDAVLTDCTVYGVMSDGNNSYYKAYTVEYPTPVIAGTSDRTKAIIDSDEKTISLVDNQYLTVGEFKAETTGARVMNGDDEAADDALLSDCTVYATFGGDYSELDQEYTFVYSREYAIEDEDFETTAIADRTSTGKLGTAGSVDITGNTNGATGVTIGKVLNVGDSGEDNYSLALNVTNIGKAYDTFLYFDNPYVSGNLPTKTYTMEFKWFLKGNAQFKLLVGKQELLVSSGQYLYPFGNRLGIGAACMFSQEGSWIDVAYTYYKGSNLIDLYVNGVKFTTSEWTPNYSSNDVRIDAIWTSGASGTIAIDDLKLYTGGLEEYKLAYYKDGVETTDIASANTVKVVASDSFNYVPVLAKYQAGELVAISVGTNKTAEMTIGDASEVKFFYWNSVTGATPFEKSKTVYASDGVNPVTAYNATLSNAFGNGMVLQRGEEIKVWGTANDANYSALTVALGDEKKTAYVMDGEWEVSFDARSANSDGIDLTVTTLSSTTQVNDILIGDVYVVAGQSNAALPLSVTSEYSNSEMRSFDGNVRMLYQPRDDAACTEPRKTLIDKCEWGIVEFQKGSAYAATVLPRYSALGIYFGEYLADGLEAANIDVPIGIIEATLGGTSLFEHVNEEIFNKYNPTYLATANKASRIYNKNIAPFEKFAVNGVIWYQGENESIGSIIDESTKIYADMFADYLGQYRQTDDFNAFVVQLSSHTTNAHSDGTAGWNVPRMRAYQYDMAKNDGYYIIPSLDHGVKTEEYDAATDKSDIAAHPKYKKPIGERAANAVLAVIYGQEAAMAPVYDTITYAEDKVTIAFKNAGTGLSLANGESLLGFELIKDGVATAATATITGTNTVELTGVTGATGVRYAFYRSAPKTIANLANSYGVACPTFVHSNDGNDIGKINPISLGAME